MGIKYESRPRFSAAWAIKALGVGVSVILARRWPTFPCFITFSFSLVSVQIFILLEASV